MKITTTIFLLLSNILLILAAPPSGSDGSATVVKYEEDLGFDGNYRYSLQIDNGINIENTGTLKKVPSSEQTDVVVQSGSFSYISPEGEEIKVNYVADDEGGFQPQGSHLPTPPPIPPAIQKAVDYLLSLPPKP